MPNLFMLIVVKEKSPLSSLYCNVLIWFLSFALLSVNFTAYSLTENVLCIQTICLELPDLPVLFSRQLKFHQKGP